MTREELAQLFVDRFYTGAQKNTLRAGRFHMWAWNDETNKTAPEFVYLTLSQAESDLEVGLDDDEVETILDLLHPGEAFMTLFSPSTDKFNETELYLEDRPYRPRCTPDPNPK